MARTVPCWHTRRPRLCRYAFALGIHTLAPECDARHYTENMSFQGTKWQGIWRGDASPRRSHLIASLDRSDLTTVPADVP